MSGRSFWNSATTRAVAIVTLLGVFVVYLMKTWRRAGIETSTHDKRVKIIKLYDKQREELKDQSIDQINEFEERFQSKMREIDTNEQAIILDASRSRRSLANALNKSFGK
tara:strand:- start:1930 stop:2259 length:330 start_codon:yes stop_codon:yes gene_type:complete